MDDSPGIDLAIGSGIYRRVSVIGKCRNSVDPHQILAARSYFERRGWMDGGNDRRNRTLDAATFRSTGRSASSAGWMVAAGPASRWLGNVGVGSDDRKVHMDRDHNVDNRCAVCYSGILDTKS